jgi:lambda repressor-like predicted transcriptional regulator
MHPKNDPTNLVDEWPLPSLSLADRKRIKAHLLSASAAYKRGNPSDSRRFVAPIQQAFDGIASILFDAKILTPEVLKNQLPLLLLESAIAAGWLHYVQPLTEISAEFFQDYPDVFSAEIDEWLAKLLERDAEENKSAEWSPLRQDFEAFKAIKKVITGPREQIRESFVRDSIARQYGIKPEEVTMKQIRFEVAGLVRDYPGITVIPSESSESTIFDNPQHDSKDIDEITDENERRAFVIPLLDKKGWSILDWANEAGVSHATAIDYLDKKTKPYRSTRLKLAKALGVNVEQLPK